MSAGGAVDVLVAGGGPAGLAAAAELARRGRTVRVCERRPADAPRVGEVLPAVARGLLEELGVRDRFLRQRHRRARGTVSVWGAPTPAESPSILHPHGGGWHLDREAFDGLLWRQARERGAEMVRPARVAGVEAVDGGYRVDVREAGSAVEVRARAVVDGTGRNAFVLRRLGGGQRRRDRLVGVCRRYRIPEDASPDAGRVPDGQEDGPGPDDPVLLVEAVASGWWYTAVQPRGGVVAAFMTDADLWGSSPGAWHRALERAPHTRRRCAGLEEVGDGPMVRPAVTARARCPSRLAVGVGDAAAAFDPLSSDGISFALRSGLEAARALGEGLEGGAGALHRYASAVDRIYERYLERRTEVYAGERRWPDAPFWRRRHAGARHRAEPDDSVTPRA